VNGVNGGTPLGGPSVPEEKVPAFSYDSSGTLERGTQRTRAASKRMRQRSGHVVQPIIRTSIRPLAQKVSRCAAKLERRDSAGPG
jgi:hypothetical protein